MPRPTLPPAVILETSGWQQTAPRGSFVVEFEDDGDGWIVIADAKKGKVAYKFQPAFLTLAVRNGVIQSGGGLVEAGFGGEGASGVVDHDLLNRLTTNNPHHGVLIFNDAQPPRTVVLGYESVVDEEIAQRIGEAIPAYMDYWGGALVERLRDADDAQRRETAPAVETMARHGWFTSEQLRQIEAYLPSSTGVDTAAAVEDESPSSAPPPVAQRMVPDSAQQVEGGEGGGAEREQSPPDRESVVGDAAGEHRTQQGGTKTCPMCAEEVKAAALVCRFCGYQFKDQLPIPARPAGQPPEALTALLGPGEELFVWSPGLLNAGEGTVAITSDRVLFVFGGRADPQHPINHNRKATVGAGSPTMPASCRPDGTVVIEFADDGHRFDFHGLNPEVAKEIGATVVSGLIDKLFPNNAEMQQTLRTRHDRISARVSALAPTTTVTIKHCQYLGGVSGTKTAPGSRGALTFSPAEIKFMMWWVEGFNFQKGQWSSIAVYGAQEMQRLTATRMIGLGLFSLAAPKRRVNSYIVVTLPNRETAVFEVNNASVMDLQARLSPWLAGH